MTIGAASTAATAIQPANDQASNDDASTPSSSSSSTSSSAYQDPSTNDLTILSASLLLTADCMGTVILALPADVEILGKTWGIGFLLLNLPINLYAGTVLGWCALFVEERILMLTKARVDTYHSDVVNDNHNDAAEMDSSGDERVHKKQHNNQSKTGRKKGYSSVKDNDASANGALGVVVEVTNQSDAIHSEWNEDETDFIDGETHPPQHADTATTDFVGMTSMLFDEPILPLISESFSEDNTFEQSANHIQHHKQQQKQLRSITYNHTLTKLVLTIYYINLFLVLGNYILVMSHAVSAMAGEDNLCIPTAGVIASTLMFALSQLRTMAHLGRSVSAASLLALLIVVIQCLYALRGDERYDDSYANEQEYDTTTTYTIQSTTERVLSKMSSLASIGFAVGSQKLFLNIRHEMADRTKAAPTTLSISLSLYGIAYIAVCLLAGPRPPSFLFDAIPSGVGRQIAGFLLWIHVAVSYAINSQALCSSLDRMVVHLKHVLKIGILERRHRLRWGILTFSVAVASYLVANAIPFFKVSYPLIVLQENITVIC